MKIFLKVIFWTFWLVLGFIFHGVFFSYLNDKDMMFVFIVLLVLWWGITAVISLVKWKKYRKENPALTRDQKQKRKQIQKDIAYRNSREFKKKYYSDVEIENSYFGNGVLVKDSSSENICYKDIFFRNAEGMWQSQCRFLCCFQWYVLNVCNFVDVY